MHVDSQKFDAIIREPYSYYDSASVPKWPQKQSQSIYFLKISLGSMAPDPPSLPCLCMHVTPLLKILATGLKQMSERIKSIDKLIKTEVSPHIVY